MSFGFSWPTEFPDAFYEHAKRALSQALNSGKRPSLVADQIVVQDLNLGSIPPELDLLAIEELSVDGTFKARFMLSYNGDAYISLATHVQVNPLTQYKHALEFLSTPSALLQTAQMFVELKLSQLRLRCVISVAFSKKAGLTLAFKDDPLESLNVSSSFDSISVIHSIVQTEIEHQLRERFRRDLPGLIHRLSQKWLADMGQQPADPASIVVEREPDDSFHDEIISSSDPDGVDSSDETSSPSPNISSSEESASEDESTSQARPSSFKSESSFRRPPSPAAIISRSPPKRSSIRRPSGILRENESSIIRSLQRKNSTFATTFSKPLEEHLSDLPDSLANQLLVGNEARKATRTRLHRLESPSPQTSPQKPKYSKQTREEKERQRMRLHESEMDEYFPIQPSNVSRTAIPSRNEFDLSQAQWQRQRDMANGRSHTSNKPSLRRNMLSSRLRDTDFFDPNYPLR